MKTSAFLTGRTVMDPMSQLVPTAQRERALPLSSHTDPHIYNPTPSAAETSLRLWPAPLHHLTPVHMQHWASVVTLLLWGLPLSCYPHITACREEERDEREGRGGICAAAHKAATIETLTEASVMPWFHTLTCCPRAWLGLSSSVTPSRFLLQLPAMRRWEALGRLL